MDTGEITIKMVTDSNLPIESSEQVLHDATPIIESVAKVWNDPYNLDNY